MSNPHNIDFKQNAVGEWYSEAILDFAKYLASKIFEKVGDSMFIVESSTRERNLWNKYFSKRGIFPNYRNRELNWWIDEVSSPVKKEEEITPGKYMWLSPDKDTERLIEIISVFGVLIRWVYYGSCTIHTEQINPKELTKI